MNDIPSDLRYTKSHEWVRVEDDGSITVGITDHAQDLMGDMVYIEVPEDGTSLEAGKDCAVVESVKAASDVYAPVDGTVVAVNEVLADTPEILNKDPYGDGWLFRMRPSNKAQLDSLMNADAYSDLVAADE